MKLIQGTAMKWSHYSTSPHHAALHMVFHFMQTLSIFSVVSYLKPTTSALTNLGSFLKIRLNCGAKWMSLVYLYVTNTLDTKRLWSFSIVREKLLITRQKPHNTRESRYEFKFKKLAQMNFLLWKAARLAMGNRNWWWLCYWLALRWMTFCPWSLVELMSKNVFLRIFIRCGSFKGWRLFLA